MSSVETMSRWPLLITSVAALPPRYAEGFMQNTGKKDCSSMYAVYAPLIEILWFYRGGQFICIDGDTLYFFRPKGAGVDCTKVTARELNYIRLKRCLLSSEMEINVLQGGVAQRLKTEYNSVREELYEPVLDFFRGPKRDINAVLKERDEKYSHLLHQNFKLLNMGLKAYDRTCGSNTHIYQEGIYLKHKWIRKKVTAGFLFISTENEFIAVEDIDYGTEYHYMRKSAICNAGLDFTPEGFHKLIIEFSQNKLEFPVSSETEAALHQIILTP